MKNQNDTIEQALVKVLKTQVVVGVVIPASQVNSL
jgi:hypothetical protein